VRAEAERLGLRSPRATSAAPAAGVQAGSASINTAKIVVTERGFEPDRLNVRAGSVVRLTFVRTTDKTCATEVVFPSLHIKRALPLNKSVSIEFTPAKPGEITFACGMNMLEGVVVID
jgi:plastocyanin domain-containing protein